jgi:hypothetical protein
MRMILMNVLLFNLMGFTAQAAELNLPPLLKGFASSEFNGFLGYMGIGASGSGRVGKPFRERPSFPSSTFMAPVSGGKWPSESAILNWPIMIRSRMTAVTIR